MSYYFFNRCPKNCLPKIEEFAREYHLEECEPFPPAREWTGDSFKRRIKFDREAMLVYNPVKKYPLTFQTASKVTHKQKDVKSAVRRLIGITGSTEISDFSNLYDLAEFS